MKCRKINQENGMITWFNIKHVEIVKDEDGNEIAKPTFDTGNYAYTSEGVANSLVERLSVLKHELWYDYNNGMPIVDKTKSKAIIDAYVIQTILEHPDVLSIEGFESRKEQHSYTCYFVVNTIYGQVELGI